MNEERRTWYIRSTAHAEYFGVRWRYYYAELTAMLRPLIPPDVSLVQLGSGDGNLLATLPGASRVGIETSPLLATKSREHHADLEIIEDDFWSLSTKRTFNTCLISEITDSLLDAEVVFREVRSILSSDGRLIIVSRSFLWRPIFALGRLLFRRTRSPFLSLIRRRDLENLLYLAGYEVVSSGRGILCPFAIPLIGPLCNRVLARLPLISALCALRYVVARPQPLSTTDTSVSVVVAARNERGNLQPLLQRVPTLGTSTEVIIVEGNSSDGTWEELERIVREYTGPHTIVIAKQEGKGKWDAVKKGFSLATGDLLMVLDADMTVPPEDLPRFYRAFAEGRGEFINGSRLIYPMEAQAMRFLNKVGNHFFAMMVGAIIGQRVTDTLCGTKVLRKSDWHRISSAWAQVGARDPFGDFELIFGAARLNLRIVEMPVRYRDRSYGKTQIHRFRDGVVLLRLTMRALLKFRFNI